MPTQNIWDKGIIGAEPIFTLIEGKYLKEASITIQTFVKSFQEMTHLVEDNFQTLEIGQTHVKVCSKSSPRKSKVGRKYVASAL